jgi:hypothetical protein
VEVKKVSWHCRHPVSLDGIKSNWCSFVSPVAMESYELTFALHARGLNRTYPGSNVKRKYIKIFQAMSRKTLVGIVGYGHLGQYLAQKILTDPIAKEKLEIAWVWNRSVDKIKEDKSIPEDKILYNLDDFQTRKADLILEVCHPQIIKYLFLLNIANKLVTTEKDSYNLPILWPDLPPLSLTPI